MARVLKSLRECKRPHSHHYLISAAILLDIQWWLDFLPRFSRVSVIRPSFWDSENFHFSTDARLHGASAVCHTKCTSFVFPNYISPSTLHISALERFTIVVSLEHWAPQLPGHKFLLSCNNSAAVAVNNSTTSKDPFMQRCLRQLRFAAALFDFEVHAQHVPGKHNQFADYLSCWHSDPSARASFHHICKESNLTFCFQDVDSASFSFDVA